MRTNENASMVFMTMQEIKEQCLFFEENRNHYLNENEANIHHFTKYDVFKTKSRVGYYKTNIFKKQQEWKDCCPMIVYKINGKLFIVDGQGRWLALEEYNKTVKDENLQINEVPVMIFFNKSYEQMLNDVVSMNTCQRNWNMRDKMRLMYMASSEEEEYEKLLSYKVYIEDELQVQDYTSNLILFGSARATHKDAIDNNIKISPYCETMFNAFKEFYNIATESCYGNKRETNTIRKQDVAQALYRIYASIIRVCEKENIDYNKRLIKVAQKLGKYIATLDRQYKFPQVLGGKQNAVNAYFVQELNRRTDDRYIKQALKEAA